FWPSPRMCGELYCMRMKHEEARTPAESVSFPGLSSRGCASIFLRASLLRHVSVLEWTARAVEMEVTRDAINPKLRKWRRGRVMAHRRGSRGLHDLPDGACPGARRRKDPESDVRLCDEPEDAVAHLRFGHRGDHVRAAKDP